MRCGEPCRVFAQRYRKAIRWIALLLSIALTLLGLVSQPVNDIGFCRVYP
ncbi:MAG: hypothetical protein FWF20_09615 [Betaproteobacteria bacterium]|nr:hypothetical protein [Betaproteobacteria bacterium]MCL2887020.1 hypothetical protein [Betaproteobacteria bacterium]